ncbi:MAG: class I SAM-dependent methyltransferase [Simkania sp.]|nr:class I SAM-dependent methyltransferase [Simkania sp.]
MNSQISWQNLLFLQSIEASAAYLKIMSEVWGVQVRSIVEIGVFDGRTSKLFRALFPDAFLYLIDPWQLYDEYLSAEAGPISKMQDDYENAYREVKETFKQDQKVEILRKTSMEALDDVPDGIDLVYIDGNHSYFHVKQDIEHWFPKVCPMGMLSGHDYNPSYFPGVIKAVNELFPESVVLGQDYTWLKQKT